MNKTDNYVKARIFCFFLKISNGRQYFMEGPFSGFIFLERPPVGSTSQNHNAKNLLRQFTVDFLIL